MEWRLPGPKASDGGQQVQPSRWKSCGRDLWHQDHENIVGVVKVVHSKP